MRIEIDTAGPEPVYEQIVGQIQDAVKSGVLGPGVPLPTVRQLAGDLQINRNTVARAYKMLEDQAVISTARRKGTFIRSGAAEEVVRLRRRRAEGALRRVVHDLLTDGLGRDEISEIFAQAVSIRTGEAK
jgi:GntR family transcriptional regulator